MCPDKYFSYISTNLGYSLKVPLQGALNEYSQHIFLQRNKQNIPIFGVKKGTLYRAIILYGGCLTYIWTMKTYISIHSLIMVFIFHQYVLQRGAPVGPDQTASTFTILFSFLLVCFAVFLFLSRLLYF